jgi:hypothetical protein
VEKSENETEDAGKMNLDHMGLSKIKGVPRKIHAKLSACGFNLFTSFYARRHFKLS